MCCFWMVVMEVVWCGEFWGGEGLPSCILVDCLHFSGINCCCLDLVDDCARIFWYWWCRSSLGEGGTGGEGMSCFPLPSYLT